MAANLHMRKGEAEQSIAAYGRAIALEPHADLHRFSRGNAYQAKGDHAAAAKDFRKSTQLDPSNYKAWNNLGSAYMSTEASQLPHRSCARTWTCARTLHGLSTTFHVIAGK